jgi:hypothetical protein
MSLRKVALLAALPCSAALLGLFLFGSATIRSDKENILLNRCVGRLIAVRNAVLLYHEQNGRYPLGLTNLAPEYIEEPLLYCPKANRRGPAGLFYYANPSVQTNAKVEEWLLKSRCLNYSNDGRAVAIGITLSGKVEFLAGE